MKRLLILVDVPERVTTMAEAAPYIPGGGYVVAMRPGDDLQTACETLISITPWSRAR